MTIDQAIDWAMRVVMAALTIFVFLWGKSAKQVDALLAAQFALRDERIDELNRRMSAAGQKASDGSDVVQGLIGVIGRHDERLKTLEKK